MSPNLHRSLAGLALLAALAAGCSSSGSSHPAKPHHNMTSPASANQIPQNNGGDHDGDNNGGPSDGDGNL